MVHRSVIRETIVDTLSCFVEANDPELEEALLDSFCNVFDVYNDEDAAHDLMDDN